MALPLPHRSLYPLLIDVLRASTYVLEDATRVQLKGEYQSGIAELQCMYAPEFNSHSGSVRLEVR